MPKKKENSSWICRHLEMKTVQSLKMSGSDYTQWRSVIFQYNEILRYSAAKASIFAWRNIKKSQRQQSLIECSIFRKEDKEDLAIWDGTDLSLGLSTMLQSSVFNRERRGLAFWVVTDLSVGLCAMLQCSIFSRESRGLAFWDGTDLYLGLCAMLQCSIFNRERRGLAFWDGTDLSLGLYGTWQCSKRKVTHSRCPSAAARWSAVRPS